MTRAHGLNGFVIECEQNTLMNFFVRCTRGPECSWVKKYVAYPGRGVSLEDVILDTNIHMGKEH